MAARRDVEQWQRFVLAVIALVGGIYMVVWHKDLLPIGGTMIGTVLAFYFVNSGAGNGGADGIGRTGGPSLPPTKRGRFGMKLAQVATGVGRAALVAACALLPSWGGSAIAFDAAWFGMIGSLAVGVCLGLALVTIAGRVTET